MGDRVIADWPGLMKHDLYENRDLNSTADLRNLFEGVLTDHLQLRSGFIDSDVSRKVVTPWQ